MKKFAVFTNYNQSRLMAYAKEKDYADGQYIIIRNKEQLTDKKFDGILITPDFNTDQLELLRKTLDHIKFCPRNYLEGLKHLDQSNLLMHFPNNKAIIVDEGKCIVYQGRYADSSPILIQEKNETTDQFLIQGAMLGMALLQTLEECRTILSELDYTQGKIQEKTEIL